LISFRKVFVSIALNFALTWQVFGLDCAPLEFADPVSSPVEYSHGLLWRVESQSGAQSYLYGTIHLSDPRVTDVANPIQTKIRASQRFVMEVVLDSNALTTMSQAMVLPAGETLGDIVGSDLLLGSATLLGRYGLAGAAVNRLKPWAAYITLALPPDRSGMPLDLVLSEIARRSDVETFGLERIEDQIEIFDSLPISIQVGLLSSAVCHYDTISSEMEGLIKSYLASDLASMMNTALRYRSAEIDRLMEAVLWRRNRTMADSMVPYLELGDAFIAVGALHLPGADGILDLLVRRGYIVAAVD
jgi:uncharacterized protein YbaP (TraB family)